ncbi:hypothetical protein HF521_020506 [Silurus meridionalis]|uniref:non-specific serine/threonine protein kinase n=1 Tax=Silurus meridionalis TaxID=175797 RepID=A0A8T0BIH2_SILME|nr:hypothetical protein HF521_020506 [Silurus meridionalis]
MAEEEGSSNKACKVRAKPKDLLLHTHLRDWDSAWNTQSGGLFKFTQEDENVQFDMIGQRLSTMNLLSLLAISDEFSTVRLQHSWAFAKLPHAASSSLFSHDQMYLNGDAQNPVQRFLPVI